MRPRVFLSSAARKDETMKALAWHGRDDIRCDNVPDSKAQDSRNAIIKVTACAICGSDLDGCVKVALKP
jgi:threonine dehydrogenase-like Zn-dependent dehydrogenase